jgi:dihydroorotase
MYDLLVKNGLVIDSSQGLHDQRDIGISEGKITALKKNIPPAEAGRVIDAGGKLVTPGLIDIHTHVADGIVPGTTPDEAGVLSGVTTVCDAGSTGYANFKGFRQFILPRARTAVFAFLNLGAAGLAFTPEVWSWENINIDAMLRVIKKNSDIIKGIKLRAAEMVIKNLGPEAIRAAKKVAVQAGLPLMIHIGVSPDEKGITEKIAGNFTREMLSILDKGDIITHVYTPKAGRVFESDGKAFPELKKAAQRGVIFDIGQGPDIYSNWSYDLARKGLEQGILPTTISTDLADNLPKTMSQFLAVGLTLDKVIEMTTINPARILNEDKRRGSLRTGSPADLSILKLTEGEYLFSDGSGGKPFKGDRLLEPKLTIKSGRVFRALPYARLNNKPMFEAP